MTLENNLKKDESFEKLNALLDSLHKEHQHSLDVCRAIQEGMRQNIDCKRIKSYADWHFQNELQPHFEIEKKLLFPILGMENHIIKKILTKQRRLKKHFAQKNEIEKSLSRFEEDLELMIRLEERNVFPTIRNNIAAFQSAVNSTTFFHEPNTAVWKDVFWQ